MSDCQPSSPKATRRIVVACLLGLAALFVGGALSGITFSLWPEFTKSVPWSGGASNHTGMLIASILLALALARGRLSEYGFRIPQRFSLARLTLLSVGISAVVFVVEKVSPGEGLTFTKEYSLLQTILFIWVYASIAEEVLTRGLIQSFLTPLADRGFVLGRLRISTPVLVGALFFGGMHLMLFTMGIDAWTVLLIVVFAFALGLVAGHYREKTGSLIPAIIAHSLANITGTILELLWKA